MVVLGIYVILIVGYMIGIYLLINKADEDTQTLSNNNVKLRKILEQKPIEENVLKEKIEHALEEKNSAVQDLENEKLASERLKDELDNVEKEKNSAVRDMERGKVELLRLKNETDHEVEKAKEKEQEKARLSGQLDQIKNEMTNLKAQADVTKQAEVDFQALERIVEEQMEYAHEISQGIDKNRVTMKLLDEKSKENLELMKQLSD